MDSFRVSEALTSVRRLRGVIENMTEDEIVRAIALEEDSLRRKSILTQLRSRAKALALAKHEQSLNQAINKEK